MKWREGEREGEKVRACKKDSRRLSRSVAGSDLMICMAFPIVMIVKN
jgi:hypothetical protein